MPNSRRNARLKVDPSAKQSISATFPIDRLLEESPNSEKLSESRRRRRTTSISKPRSLDTHVVVTIALITLLTQPSMNGTLGTVGGFQADVRLSLVRRMQASNTAGR
jgi:hypothetical protein